MVMVNAGTAFVLSLLLCAAWLSSARLLHPGAEVNNAPSASMISADATACTKSQTATMIFDDENESSKTVNVELSLSSSSSSSSSSNYNEKRKRRSLRRHWTDEVDKGFVAFSADYHGPRHHPPKNN